MEFRNTTDENYLGLSYWVLRHWLRGVFSTPWNMCEGALLRN